MQKSTRTPHSDTHRRVAGGELIGSREANGTHAWRGIRYAQPPTGALRWRAPQPVPAWNGVFHALDHGPMAPQYAGLLAPVPAKLHGRIVGDEDCLSLNIFAPAWTPDAIETMERYPWPGNVRELANIVERLSIMQPGAEVTGARVREVLRPTPSASQRALEAATPAPDSDASLSDSLDDYERRLINEAIDSSRGNIAEAARKLRTDRPNLYRRMRRLGIGQKTDSNEIETDLS